MVKSGDFKPGAHTVCIQGKQLIYCDFFTNAHTVCMTGKGVILCLVHTLCALQENKWFIVIFLPTHTHCVRDIKSGDFKPVAHTVCITGNKWFIVIFLHTNTLCA